MKDRAAFIGVVQKRFTEIVPTSKVEIKGVMTEIKGKPERVQQHVITFRSLDRHLDEMLKTRMNLPDEMPFGLDDGFQKFSEAYEKAVVEAKSKKGGVIG